MTSEKIREIIGQMTLEEKAAMCSGADFWHTESCERLGIPSSMVSDGPHGLRKQNDKADHLGVNESIKAVCFPAGCGTAASFNRELLYHMGETLGNECQAEGISVLLGPAVNIKRSPLCGRNFEYYSEDPLVSGKIAAAYVRGIQSNGVGTSIKHFAVNNQETNRNANDARITPRALREIYLKGFEIAVKESAPWTVMSSYNHINGTYASENTDLLSTLLRDEWNFEGMVVTDWFGGKDAVTQMIAGNDMLQPGRANQYDMIIEGVKSGKLDESILNRNVKRVLELILQTPHFKEYKYSNKPDLKAHAAVTRQSATEGMVLLKNNNETLPFERKVRNIALFGCTSYDFIAGGTGSGNVNRAYTVSLLDGLKNAGYQIDEALKADYEQYIEAENKKNTPDSSQPFSRFMPVPRPTELIPTTKVLSEQVAKADVALVTLGRTSGEFVDRNVSDFELSEEELQLLKSVSQAFHAAGKKVVVVLNIGGVIETASWKKLPDAILLAWQAGQEGGNSVTDVLSGKVSPSGKLTMTFPNKLMDVASSTNFPMDARANTDVRNKEDKRSSVKNVDYTDYEEDIFVGYRYFDSFGKQVSYPFGYGLSYTTFEYVNPSVKVDNGIYSVSIDVKNVGKFAGKEVVQLYVSAPNRFQMNKPEKELKAFTKTKELRPGETVTATLKLNTTDLASYDEASSSWVVDAGNYKFLIGTSSKDIKAVLDVDVVSVVEKTNDILKPQETVNTIKR